MVPKLRLPSAVVNIRPRNGPFGLCAATLLAPHFSGLEGGPAGPFFVRSEAANGDDIREGEATRAGDRAAGRARPAGRRGARPRADDADALLPLRRPPAGCRPRALRARDRAPPRLPARIHGRRVLARDDPPAAQAAALRERRRPQGLAAHGRAGG